ncbi:hypothetical protein [Thalassotalea fusca]
MTSNLHERLTLLNEKLAVQEITQEELVEYKQLLELSNAIFRVHQLKHQPESTPRVSS